MTPVAVIINVGAGAGGGRTANWADQLVGKFREFDLDATITLAASGADLVAAARQAVQQGAAMVVAGGGDGTVNAVASVLVGSTMALGVLPLGTLNHFAKDLHIPLVLDDAICNLARGIKVKVDVGAVNDRIFLNNSSLGLYPDIVRDREKQQRRLGRGKWLAFCWASMAALRRFPFLKVHLKVNGGYRARRTPFIFIGNNIYRMHGLNIGERERLDGGMLSLYMAQSSGRLGLVRLALSALFGRLAQAKNFEVLLTQEMVIETHHKRLRVAIDGEVTILSTPLHYRIRAAVLTVILPAP